MVCRSGGMAELPSLLLSLKSLSIDAPKTKAEDDGAGGGGTSGGKERAASPTKKQRMGPGEEQESDGEEEDDEFSESDDEPPQVPPWEREGSLTRRAPSPSQVFNDWKPGEQPDGDFLSWPYLKQSYVDIANRDPVMLMQAECSCSMFLKLATGRLGFHNDTGQPDDWQFQDGGTHSSFETDFKPDYAYLEIEPNTDEDDPEDWKVFGHDGRHRISWIQNQLGIPTVVIYIGVRMGPDPIRANEPRRPRVADTILEQWPDERIGPRCSAKLLRNTRPGGVPWRLEEIVPRTQGAGPSSSGSR